MVKKYVKPYITVQKITTANLYNPLVQSNKEYTEFGALLANCNWCDTNGYPCYQQRC